MFVVLITDGDRGGLASCVIDVLAGEQRKAAWPSTPREPTAALSGRARPGPRVFCQERHAFRSRGVVKVPKRKKGPERPFFTALVVHTSHQIFFQLALSLFLTGNVTDPLLRILF